MVLALKTRIPSIQWRWVLSAGAAVAILAYLLVWVVVVVYVFVLSVVLGGEANHAQLSSFAQLMGVWGLPALTSLLAIPVALWIVRRAGTQAAAHGALVGLVSAIGNQLVGLFYGPLLLDELLRIVPLAVGAGWFGGIWGQAALKGQLALYQTSRAVSAALRPQDIVASIAEHLADPKEVSQVSLWQLAPGAGDDAPMEYELLAAWSSKTAQPSSPYFCLKTAQVLALAGLGQQRQWLSLKVGELPVSERNEWEQQDIRSAILLPLATTSNAQVGLLMVSSRRANSFPRRTVRAYLTISAQVALVLENFRLVEQAQQAGVLRERQRMAHEIHDTLAQGFTSIVLNLEAAEGALPQDLESMYRRLDQAQRTARESLAEARRLVWALRPESLERSSLSEALSRLAERHSDQDDASVSFSFTGTPRPLSPESEVTLLRTAQEALSNIRKYARASQVVMTLSYMKDLVALDVHDDGVGFEPARAHKADHSAGGFGLIGMRERAEQLGGTLVIESAPGKGTTLMVELPADPGGLSAHAVEAAATWQSALIQLDCPA
jgi:signal transduction histidine kinase